VEKKEFIEIEMENLDVVKCHHEKGHNSSNCNTGNLANKLCI